MNAETKRLNNERCDFLIATPGRLLDHLQNGGLKPKLSGLRTLIFDEADRLLEQGFRQDCERIISHLPSRQAAPRQSLMFSATIPPQVHQLGAIALAKGFKFVSTIPDDEQNTHQAVPQFSLLPPSLLDVFPQTLALLREEIRLNPATKAMVFLPTARATGLVAALFKRVGLQQLAPGFDTYEIHSRKSQSQRNAAAEAFKVAQGGVLFSSDVTARGMDFRASSSLSLLLLSLGRDDADVLLCQEPELTPLSRPPRPQPTSRPSSRSASPPRSSSTCIASAARRAQARRRRRRARASSSSRRSRPSSCAACRRSRSRRTRSPSRSSRRARGPSSRRAPTSRARAARSTTRPRASSTPRASGSTRASCATPSAARRPTWSACGTTLRRSRAARAGLGAPRCRAVRPLFLSLSLILSLSPSLAH